MLCVTTLTVWECCMWLLWLFENVVCDYSGWLHWLFENAVCDYSDLKNAVCDYSGWLHWLFENAVCDYSDFKNAVWDYSGWLFENVVCDYSGWLHWLFEFLDDGPVQLVTEVLHCALVHFHYNRRRVVWKLSFRFGVTVNYIILYNGTFHSVFFLQQYKRDGCIFCTAKW